MLEQLKIAIILVFALLQAGCFLNAKVYSLASDFDLQTESSLTKAISIENSTIVSSHSTNFYKNTKVRLTVITKDQFGNQFYDANSSIEFVTTGTNQDGWFVQSVIDNKDGTYSAEYYFEKNITGLEFSAKINGKSLPVNTKKNVINPRLKFTGNSTLSAPVASRTLSEIQNTFVLSGECDPELGDVKIRGIDETSFIDIKTSNWTPDFTLNVPCNTSNGGEFSTTINFNTAPSFDIAFGIGYIQASQNVLPEIQTYLFKAPSSNPVILINNLTELSSITCNDNTKFYVLNADIDVAAVTGVTVNNFTTLCFLMTPFKGVFDGNNHKISGINRTSSTAFQVGFFDTIENATISNLHLDNITLRHTFASAGGLVGEAIGTDNFLHNIYVNNANITGVSEAGGLVGSGMLINFYNVHASNSTISANQHAGGILGEGMSNSIIKCSSLNNTIPTSTVGYSGGVAGNLSYMQYCVSNASISSPNSLYTGGLTGNALFVYDSYFYGNIIATGSSAYAGGITGHSPVASVYNVLLLGIINSNSSVLNTFFNSSFESSSAYGKTYFSKTGVCSNCTSKYINEGLPLDQLYKRDTYPTFDFINIWKIDEGVSAPTFRFNQ